MLGILAILLQSLKLTTSSNYRTIAAMQAQAMAEKLRANPTALFTSVDPTTGNPTANYTFTSPPASTTSTTNCLKAATTCSVGAFVATSIAIWKEQLAQTLPKGQGTVCQDSDPINHTPDLTASPVDWKCSNTTGISPVAIKVCWNETRVQASSDNLGAGGWLCVAEAL
jgi:type IV pilus assembly protein PilV